jgi:23S rRNA (cytosine1962-C5)-methyltransferase
VHNPWPDYELLDFGGGRKLERWGQTVVNRPAPGATAPPHLGREQWKHADWTYAGDRVADGRWKSPTKTSPWTDEVDIPLTASTTLRATLERLPTGQVGLFPEQFANWQWIAQRVANKRLAKSTRPLRVLNLFGYTGGSTLAAAAAGAEVTHVDASRPAVNRARDNAVLSGLSDNPIRWIVEDAVKYAERECRRGSRYDAVILDPPSYGHGPKGESWQLVRDLPKLLAQCRRLTGESPAFLLLSCHTPGVGPAELSAYLSDGLVGHCGAPPRCYDLTLTAADGRRLPSGIAARWPA